MSEIINRVKWSLWGRQLQSRKTRYFNASVISYCNDSTFEGFNVLYGRSVVLNSKIGRHTYIAGASVSHCEIGSFCSIGPKSLVGGLGEHPTNMISSHPAFYSNHKQSGATFSEISHFPEYATTLIGCDVWVGANVTILDGIKIGHGVIIAAGAVVTKDVPDYAIVGGVPAKLIRFRFSHEQVDKLLQCEWWNRSDSILTEIAHIFRSGDVNELISALNIIDRRN